MIQGGKAHDSGDMPKDMKDMTHMKDMTDMSLDVHCLICFLTHMGANDQDGWW